MDTAWIDRFGPNKLSGSLAFRTHQCPFRKRKNLLGSGVCAGFVRGECCVPVNAIGCQQMELFGKEQNVREQSMLETALGEKMANFRIIG